MAKDECVVFILTLGIGAVVGTLNSSLGMGWMRREMSAILGILSLMTR